MMLNKEDLLPAPPARVCTPVSPYKASALSNQALARAAFRPSGSSSKYRR
jgi:hypothetical protein